MNLMFISETIKARFVFCSYNCNWDSNKMYEHFGNN